jgi:transcriptional regulator with XRE-family HTH domain
LRQIPCASSFPLAPIYVSDPDFRTNRAVSPAQIRAGRGLLDWSRTKLAKESGVSLRALVEIESGLTARPHARTLNAVTASLMAAGVEFIPANGGGPGVRLTREAALREALAVAKRE